MSQDSEQSEKVQGTSQEGISVEIESENIDIMDNHVGGNGNEDLVPSLSPGSSDLTQETSDFGDQSLSSTGETKPAYSYASLISQAINSTQEKKMTLHNIYAWISSHFSYYKANDSGWQNSIRHNLSLNKCFVKIPRTDSEPGKGAFWAIDPSVKDMFDMNTMRKKRTRNPNSAAAQQQLQQQNQNQTQTTTIDTGFIITEETMIDSTSTIITPLTTTGAITTITLNNGSGSHLSHPPKKRRMSQPLITSPIKKAAPQRKFSACDSLEVPKKDGNQRASPVPVFKMDHLSFFPTSSLFQQQKPSANEDSLMKNEHQSHSHQFASIQQDSFGLGLGENLVKNNPEVASSSVITHNETFYSPTPCNPSLSNNSNESFDSSLQVTVESQETKKEELGDLDWSGNSVLNNEEIFIVQECDNTHSHVHGQSDVWAPMLVLN